MASELVPASAVESGAGLAPASWLDASEVLSYRVEPPDWLVDGFIARGDIALLAAPAAHGKSLLSLGLSCSVATAEPAWGGLRVPKRRRVAYLGCEMNHARTARYMRRIVVGSGTPSLSLGGRVGFWIGRGYHLDVESDRQLLIGELLDFRDAGTAFGVENGLDLIVIDTLRRCLNGDEQDSGACAAFFRGVQEVVAALGGPAVLLLHHLRKVGQNDRSEPSERIRGSTDILNAIDHAYVVVSKHGGRHRIECAKSRERALDPLVIRFDGWEAVEAGAEDHAAPLRLVLEDAVNEVLDKDAETRKAILGYLNVQPNGCAAGPAVIGALEGPGRSERTIRKAFEGLEHLSQAHSTGRPGGGRAAVWVKGPRPRQGELAVPGGA